MKLQNAIVFILIATFLLSSCSTYSSGGYIFEKGDDDFQDGIAYIKENVTDPLVVVHIKTNNNAHIRVYSYDGGDYFIGEDLSSEQEIKSSIENINELNIKTYYGAPDDEKINHDLEEKSLSETINDCDENALCHVITKVLIILMLFAIFA